MPEPFNSREHAIDFLMRRKCITAINRFADASIFIELNVRPTDKHEIEAVIYLQHDYKAVVATPL